MEMPEGLISIIVPVYNAGLYIEETVAMVINQTYENWELILVDDCSKDDGREKIERILSAGDGRIRLIAKPVNEGAARARNTGIEAAKGRYIAFLDADDIWLPDKLR
ncbi:MAG: glycosyltransferase, partial [Lachnospiraceae bacterium]|nr:glycosyltransferase [Lachnospiraceae bacterium]